MKIIKEVTYGDVLQMLLMLLAIVISVAIAVSQIKRSVNQQTEEIKTELNKIIYRLNPQDVLSCQKGETYFFDDNRSSFSIINIAHTMKEVEVKFNVRGKIINETLRSNKSRIIAIDNEKKEKYSFILKGVQEKKAEFVVTKIN